MYFYEFARILRCEPYAPTYYRPDTTEEIMEPPVEHAVCFRCLIAAGLSRSSCCRVDVLTDAKLDRDDEEGDRTPHAGAAVYAASAHGAADHAREYL